MQYVTGDRTAVPVVHDFTFARAANGAIEAHQTCEERQLREQMSLVYDHQRVHRFVVQRMYDYFDKFWFQR